MESFLKIFRIQLFSNTLYMGMLLCSSLNLVFVIYTICFAQFLCKRNICFYNWKLNFVLFLGHFLVNISTTISTTLVKDFSWSLFSIKFQSLESLFKKISGLQTCNSIKKWLRHRCFHVNIAKFLKILKNICNRLLLT